jgi:hypothetical protein
MRKQLVTYLVFTCFLFSQVAFAQKAGLPPPDAGQSSQKRFGPKRQAAIIIFAGLGGAVLGLSTLSFYGRPQDKLSNIAIGAAVGIIVGTIYVTYKAATQPNEFYGEGYRGASLDNPNKLSIDPTDMVVGYTWNF